MVELDDFGMELTFSILNWYLVESLIVFGIWSGGKDQQ